MEESTAKLSLIMAKDGKKYTLYACRGEGKGCRRNKFRTVTKPCDDCLGPLPPEMTLEQVEARIQLGDA